MNNYNTTTIPVGFILTVIFVILKLTGAVHWSWLWVLCPLWIPIAFWLAILISVFAIGIFSFIAVIVLKLFDR